MTKRILIILTIILALAFRIYDFGHIPAGVTDDESAQGYNAYSLLLTGKDEYGKPWPVLIRSFGTYASNLYSYMTVVPVKLLGLNATSIRITSLISGLILVMLTIAALGPVAGFVVAVSPVFVFYSRAAFETNLALALLFLGLVLAVRSASRPKLLPFSFLLLSLSAYAYHVERVLSLVFIAFISIHFWKTRKKIVVLSLLLSLLVQIPIIAVSFTSGANSRVSTLAGQGNYPFLYLSYFSPNNLFSRPDPEPKKSFPNLGAFYWWMVIPFIFGITKVITDKKYQSLTGKLLLILLVVSPAIAAATRDYFATWRALPMFISLSWIISHGLDSLIRKKTWIYFFLGLIAAIELYSNLVLLKHERSINWGFPYASLANFVKNTPHETIVIDNARSSPIYIWLAFYNQYHPQKFQSMYDQIWLNDYYNHVQFDLNKKFANVDIRPIFWGNDVYVQQILIADELGISPTQAKEHFLSLVSTIPDINGHPVLNIYRTDPHAKCAAAIAQPDPKCVYNK